MANRMNLDEMCRAIGADSLAFVSNDGMYKAIGKPRGNHCDACFTGDYPVAINEIKSPQLSLLRYYDKRPS